MSGESEWNRGATLLQNLNTEKLMKFKSTKKAGGMVVELGPKEAQLPVPPEELKLKRILVPVDFSACSLKALGYAAAFAKQFGARLILIHVVESYMPVPETGMVDVALIVSQMREGAKKELEKVRLTVDAAVNPTAELREGNPHREIVQAASELGADLIVISTHGRTGLAHVFMGSIAENVVRHAGCPVLVVREQEREFVTGKPATTA